MCGEREAGRPGVGWAYQITSRATTSTRGDALWGLRGHTPSGNEGTRVWRRVLWCEWGGEGVWSGEWLVIGGEGKSQETATPVKSWAVLVLLLPSLERHGLASRGEAATSRRGKGGHPRRRHSLCGQENRHPGVLEGLVHGHERGQI